MFSTFRRLLSADRQKLQKQESHTISDNCMNINDLPNEILSLILINIPGELLCKRVILTCKKWKEIIDSEPFWINKMLHDSRASSSLLKFLAEANCLDPKYLYFKNPFVKNLIKNPCAELGYDFWDNRSLISIINSSLNKSNDYYNNEYLKKHWRNSENIQEQNGFKIEPDDFLKKPAYDSDGKPLRNYATTYFKCTKYQLIDLYAEGIDQNMLKKLRPKIEIKDSYGPRHDCGSEYHLSVVFFDENFKSIESIKFDKVFPQWSIQEWHEFKEVIENYEDTLRYILFEHSGKDTQFWAGHYGIKLRNSSVKLIFE